MMKGVSRFGTGIGSSLKQVSIQHEEFFGLPAIQHTHSILRLTDPSLYAHHSGMHLVLLLCRISLSFYQQAAKVRL